MTREEILVSMFDHRGFGLEIGPSYNPLLPKSKGFRVETADHLSSADLSKKYQGHGGVDVGLIEDVDYVCDGSFAQIESGRYDFIVASHVIEHGPDIAGFLQECDRLLRPGGVLVLAVPDKRFCFDIFRPLSSVGEAVQASLERRTCHTTASILDESAYHAMRGRRVAGWSAADRSALDLTFTLADAARVAANARAAPEYFDTHAWCFTPSSFRLLISDLNDLGLTALREQQVVTSDGFEFFVSLSRDPGGQIPSRLSLLQACVAEVLEVSDSYAALCSSAAADRAELDAIKSSRSWRLTKPLRALSVLLSRLRNRRRSARNWVSGMDGIKKLDKQT